MSKLRSIKRRQQKRAADFSDRARALSDALRNGERGLTDRAIAIGEKMGMSPEEIETSLAIMRQLPGHSD